VRPTEGSIYSASSQLTRIHSGVVACRWRQKRGRRASARMEIDVDVRRMQVAGRRHNRRYSVQ